METPILAYFMQCGTKIFEENIKVANVSVKTYHYTNKWNFSVQENIHYNSYECALDTDLVHTSYGFFFICFVQTR